MRAQIILIALLTIGYILVCTPVQSFGQQRGSLRGTVTDDRGKPLRGISITVEQLGGLTTTVETNKDGRYELRDLEPGIYAVTLNAPGSHIYKYEIQIQPFQPTVRDFSVGFGQGPIPPVPPSTPPNETSGGKKPKTPNETSGGKKPKTPNETQPTVKPIDGPDKFESLYAVQEKRVENEITVNDWFRVLEKEGKEFIRAVFPKTHGQCLFVLEQLGSRKTIHHYVSSFSGPDIRKQLEQKYNAIRNRIIVGTCEAEDGSYLIVIRDGKK